MSNPQVPMADPNAPAVQTEQPAVQTDQPSVPATSENTAGQGPVAAIPPVQQSVTVNGGDNNSQQVPTEDADTSKIGLNPNDPKNKVQPTPQYQVPPTDPGVKQASRINKIATMLTGGPHFTTTVDPVSGKVTRTQNQVSTKSLLLAVAMEALGGAAAGLQAKGPGNEGKAFGMGFQNGVQNQQASQQGQAQQDQQASQDLARQAAVTNANFTTHANAIKLLDLDETQHKQWVADSAPVIENLRNVGAVLDSGVHEGDLLSKYHVTKDMAIPDGVIPHIGADGKTDGFENTYTVIDPTAKIQLPDNIAKEAVDLRIPGTFKMVDGKAVAQDFVGTAPIKASLVVDLTQKVSGAKLTQAQFDKQLSGLNDPNDETKFEANLKSAIADGSLTTKGLQTISKYATLPINQIADTMRKDKVDSGIIGQFLNLMPEGAIEKAKINQTNQEADAKVAETRKNLVVSKTNYDSVLADPKGYSPEQVAAAKEVDQQVRHEKSTDAYNSGALHEQGVIDTKKKNGIPLTSNVGSQSNNLTHPELADLVADPKNYDTPDGTNQAFLQGMLKIDPERAKLIQAYANGMDMTSLYASAKAFGGSLLADIHAYDPTFNALSIQEYAKTQNEMSLNGKIGKANTAGSTAFVHLRNMKNAIGVGSELGSSGTFNAHKNNALSEMANFYAGGYKAGENELADWRKSFSDKGPDVDNPGQLKATTATIAAAHDMMDKIRSAYQTYDSELPRAIPRVGFIDGPGADAYHQITGEKVDVNLLRRPKGATLTVPDAKGVLHWTNANGTADFGVVPGQQ